VARQQAAHFKATGKYLSIEGLATNLGYSTEGLKRLLQSKSEPPRIGTDEIKARAREMVERGEV
jgi:hypothetical protein